MVINPERRVEKLVSGANESTGRSSDCRWRRIVIFRRHKANVRRALLKRISKTRPRKICYSSHVLQRAPLRYNFQSAFWKKKKVSFDTARARRILSN